MYDDGTTHSRFGPEPRDPESVLIMRRVFIGNIALHVGMDNIMLTWQSPVSLLAQTSQEELAELLISKFGELHSVVIIRTNDTGVPMTKR